MYDLSGKTVHKIVHNFVRLKRQDKTKERGGGLVTLDYHSSEQAICDKRSWAVHARPGSGIYLELTGALLP